MPIPIAVRAPAVKSAVVKVVCGRKYGAGFFISPNHILTCVHTLVPYFFDGAPVIVHWNGVQSEANVVDARPVPQNPTEALFPDIALLTTKTNLNPPTTLWVDGDVQPVDDVTGFGFSNDTQSVPLDMGAVIAAFQSFGTGYSSDQELIRLDHGHFQPGMSGGPLWNARTGRVCGMITRSRNVDSDLGGFAVQGRAIRYHFDALKTQIDGGVEVEAPATAEMSIGAAAVIAPTLGSAGTYVDESAAGPRRGEILHILGKIDVDAQSPPLIPELVYFVFDPTSPSARARFDWAVAVVRKHGYIAVNAHDFSEHTAGTAFTDALIAQANLVIFDFAADVSNATVFQQLGYQSALGAGPDGVVVTSATMTSFSASYPVERGVDDARFVRIVDMRLEVLEPRPPRNLDLKLLEISYVSALEDLARDRGLQTTRIMTSPTGDAGFDLMIHGGSSGLGIDIHRVSATDPMRSLSRAIKEAELAGRHTSVIPVLVLIGEPARSIRPFNDAIYFAKFPVLIGPDVRHLRANPMALEHTYQLADGAMESPSIEARA